MDIGRSFSYILEDEDWWKKILIGGLLTLIPVFGQFYGLGYLVIAIKNVIDGREVPLPEAMEDLGGKFMKGLMVFVIGFVYMLPFIIVGACAGGGASAFASIIDDSDTAGIVSGIWGACFGCLSILYSIFVGLLLPFAIATYADTGVLGDAFKVGNMFGMLKSNIGPAFIVLVMQAVAQMLASIAGAILCGIGLFATMFFAQLIMAYLYGTLYAKARAAVL